MGIGRAFAIAFSKMGFNVFIISDDEKSNLSVIEEINPIAAAH